MSSYNLADLARELQIPTFDQDAMQLLSDIEVKPPDETVVRSDDLESLINLYSDIAEYQKRVEEIAKSIRGRIHIVMDRIGIDKYEGVAGKINVIPASVRVSYSKSELDAIAKTNNALRKILDKVATKTIVEPYVRISVNKKGQS